MQELAYINGEFCPLGDAKVSIEDRGFQFADGVYEVTVAHHGQPFRLREHLARLESSLAGIGLQFDQSTYGLERVLREGIARSGFEHTLVYVQITRGTAPRAHVLKAPVKPTVVATFKALPPAPPEQMEHGVSVKTTEDIRWAKCYIKSIALLPNVLVKNEAVRQGYFDAIFVAPDGDVRESSSSNVFIVTDGVVRTPPADQHILHGITRGFLLECAAAAGIEAVETRVTRADLARADEVFLSATSFNVVPVTRLDDKPVGDGRVGPVTRALHTQCLKGVEAATAAPAIA